MKISMNAPGNEMYVDTSGGRFTAIAPVTPGEDGKIAVEGLNGKWMRITQSEWLQLIAAYAQKENSLERQPKQDCYKKVG